MMKRACAEAFRAGTLYIGFEDGQAGDLNLTRPPPQVKTWRGKNAVALPAFHSAPVSLDGQSSWDGGVWKAN